MAEDSKRHQGARNISNWLGLLGWVALAGGVLLGLLLGLATRSGPGWVIAFIIMAVAVTQAVLLFGFRQVVLLLVEIAEK